MIKRFYKVIFDPQEEGGFTVTVLALPRCIFEGDTCGEALAKLKKLSHFHYLENPQVNGLPIPDENHLIVENEAPYIQTAIA